jgi:hypothetical protein
VRASALARRAAATGARLLAVDIRLFAFLGTPLYHIVVDTVEGLAS